jgi:hypothetical protein
MAKTTTAAMDTHLAGELTTLAMAVLITRTDGQQFRFTTSSEDVDIDIGDGLGVQTYAANEGVSRTNISADSELNVDNLDIIGIFDSAQLNELELRRGLFDFADFRIFVYNHQDTTDGIIKIFRGELGEVISTTYGFFKVTLRSLVQVYSKETGEHYTKDCRADLGDIRCTIPIFPEVEGDDPATDSIDRSFPAAFIAPSTAYELGDFLYIPEVVDPTDCSQVIMNFEGTDGATSGVGFTNEGTYAVNPSIQGTSQIDTAQIPAGGDSTSSLLLDGNSDYLNWADNAALEMGANDVTMQCHFRLNATGAEQTIASKYQATTTNRSWFWKVNSSNNLVFTVYQTGATLDISLVGTTVLTTGVDYHATVVRKSNGDWEMWLGGTSEAGPTTPTSDPFNGNADLRIGALESGGAVSQFFNGWIDSFELLIGFARWEMAFTPPTGNLDPAVTDLRLRPYKDFGDVVYEVTTAGTSATCLQTPDTTITNTHAQGSAILTAHHAWMRSCIVTAVGSNARKEFTVTELTPNSGQVVGSQRTLTTLGFPDDYMNGGGVYFDTGDNAGRAREVVDFVADDGMTIEQDITMFDAFPFDIQIGDELRIFPGCDKLNATCIAKFNNGINSVSEPYVPGEDVLGQYPDAR